MIEINRNAQQNPKVQGHWQWYVNAASTCGRALGRAAVFYDLRNGNDNSQLWPALCRTFPGGTSPTVRVIGTTFDDVGSSMLIDIAHLLQTVAGYPLGVQLWLAGPVGQAWSPRLDDPRHLLRTDDQHARTLATLRELERFELNLPVPFDYVPESSKQSELRSMDGGVIRTVFLFDQKDKSARPEDDVLACMADGLLGLLHRSVNTELTRHLSLNQVQAGVQINTEGTGVACALGSYTLRSPEELLSRAMAWRLVRDLLSEAATGLLTCERCTETGEYESIGEDEWESSLNKNDLRQSADTLVEHFIAANHSASGPGFMFEVGRRARAMLNGEGTGESVLNRRNGLRRCRLWVASVRSAVARQGEQQTARKLRSLEEELEAWETWLEKDMLPVLVTQCKSAQEALRQLNHQESARHWLIDAQLEWPVYRLQVRANVDTATASPNDLLRAGRRFGWELRYQADKAEWQVALSVPAPDFVWRGQGDVQAHSVTRTDPPQVLLDHVYRIAERFTHVRNHASLLMNRAFALDPTVWFNYAAPRLRFDETAAPQQMRGLNKMALLVAPTASEAEKLRSTLANASGQSQVLTCQTGDESSITLLRIVDWIPLTSAALYDADAWQAEAILPGYYVWSPEQLAAEVETGDCRLSPRFLSWLQRDEELVNLYAQALLLDLLEPGSEAWRVPGIGVVPGRSAGEVLGHLIEQAPSLLVHAREDVLPELRLAVSRGREYLGSSKTVLRRARQERATTLNTGEQPDRDLAIYLARFA
jgi:hypothetical protein